MGAASATVLHSIHFIEARNFLVPYIFMGEIEAQRFKHLFFGEMDGTLVELVSENENGVRVVAIIFLNGAQNIRIDIFVRRRIGQVKYDDDCRDASVIRLSEAVVIWRTRGVPKAALYVVIVRVTNARVNRVDERDTNLHGA